MQFQVSAGGRTRMIIADKFTVIENYAHFHNGKGELVAVVRKPLSVKREDAMPADKM